MHEGIPILNYLVPKAFVHEDGRLTGMTFEKVKARARRRRAGASWCRPASPTSSIECDDVLVAVGQENAFPWIERDIGIEFDEWGMPVVDKVTHAVDAAATCSSAATRRSARRTSSGRWRTATTRRSRSTSCCTARTCASARRRWCNLISQKMGIHEWSYDNDVVARRALQGAAGRSRSIALEEHHAWRSSSASTPPPR